MFVYLCFCMFIMGSFLVQINDDDDDDDDDGSFKNLVILALTEHGVQCSGQ